MKTKRHLILVVATALGAALSLAQEERKPTPPGNPDLPPHPPGAERASPPPDRPRRPESDRPRDQQRRPEGERPENPRRPDAGGSPDGTRRPDGPRAEGEQRPEGGHHSGAAWHMPGPPPAPPKPTSFIGVVTAPLPPPLTAQLGLAEGFGLVVGDVLPDSPAAKAGIQRFDVLTRFNDQQLVDAGQFSTLVRAQAKDADATLTLFRNAQEQKVSVKIGEHMMPERRPFPGMGEAPHGMDKWRGPAEDGLKRLEGRAKEYGERMREFQGRMREFQERLKIWQKNPSSEMPQPPQPPQPPDGRNGQINPADILREVQPGGAAQIHLLQPNLATTYNTANAKVLIKDDRGEIEIGLTDGKRVLTAKDAQGETVFDGPIDTAEQRQALPEEVRKKLETMEVRTSIAQFEPPASAPQTAEPDVQ